MIRLSISTGAFFILNTVLDRVIEYLIRRRSLTLLHLQLLVGNLIPVCALDLKKKLFV